MLSLLGVIRRELISCRHWLWEAMALPMVMEHSSSISISKTRIPTCHLRLIWRQLAMVRYDSTLISMPVVRFVWVCWAHGEAMQLKIGILRSPPCYKSLFQSSQSLWLRMYTSMNQDSNTNKEQKREIGRMKHTPTSSGIATSNTQWSRILRIHQKVSKLLSVDISTWRKTRYWRSVRDGSSMPPRDRQAITDSSTTIIPIGAANSRKPRLSTKKCWKR